MGPIALVRDGVGVGPKRQRRTAVAGFLGSRGSPSGRGRKPAKPLRGHVALAPDPPEKRAGRGDFHQREGLVVTQIWKRSEQRSAIYRNGGCTDSLALLRTAGCAVRCCQVSPRASTIRRSEEHTSEPQSLMRISYAAFCLKKKNK